jgi:hypothetical protein
MAGELITRDRQIQWRGVLLGAGTRFRVTSLAGWLDLPEQRGSDPVLAGRHGSYPGQRLSTGRTVTVDTSILAMPEEFPAVVDALRRATAPDEDPVEEPLVVRVHGEAWMVWARCTRRAIPTDRQFAIGYTRASLQWQATDPRLYSAVEQVAQTPLSTPAGGGARFPLAFPVSLGPGRTGGGLVAHNAGHVPTWPVLEVIGPCRGPVITFASGRQLGFDPAFTVLAGQTLVIDTGLRTVEINNVSVRSRLWAHQWTPFQPGSNSVRFAAATGFFHPDTRLRARWRHAQH